MTGQTIASVPAALVGRAGKIAQEPVEAHKIAYLPGSWEGKVGGAEVMVLTRRFSAGVISRGDLFDLGDAARTGGSSARRSLLLATLMWGYGSRGGRSYRNARIILADAGLDDRLATATAALRNGDPRNAYVAIDGLRGYDEGFFTKYLYFAARNSDWPEGQPRPLTFDSTVRRSLEFIANVLNVDWAAGRPRRWSPADCYHHYCATLGRWANDLSDAECRCTPDQVEMFLFAPGNLLFDPATYLRDLATAAVDDIAAGQAGPKVRAVMKNLPTDLLASIHPVAQL